MSNPTFKTLVVAPIACLAILANAAAYAGPVTQKRSVPNSNMTQAGIGGVGGGSGSIAVTGITGTVSAAYLYWHGINNSGAGATYDNAAISFDGTPVTGVSQGDASTNCWGPGSSRAFEADVTALVNSNRMYAVSGLASNASHGPNGASLVVFYNDNIRSNNRDFVMFTGNDSIYADGAFPSDPNGWTASTPVNYVGGPVRATLHVADGQTFGDQTTSFSTASGAANFADTAALYDGNSLPSAGGSRDPNSGLYDVHTFDVTGAFGGTTGSKTLSLSAPAGGDCLALTTVLIDAAVGTIPFTTCAAEGFSGSQLTLCQRICETEQTPTTMTSLIRLYTSTYREAPACGM